ncbi:uncharacterized protein LOC131306997 [Rhododendron vialii]|uniref:uncharacterized protein LOC131306997 n=1 Tax=Rhododendron vialii TaxID=182163 RepID=UPI002660221C|nr:uncharacterized protein LOC131306997 [Rhododendron vialii]
MPSVVLLSLFGFSSQPDRLIVFDREGFTFERQRRRLQPPLELYTAAAVEDSLNLRGAMELSKGKGKAIYVAKGKKLMLDGDLEKTVTFLREKNVGVVIRDERELNQIRMHGEKAKEKPICGGKENAAPKVAPNDNVRSKAQCLRRERERARDNIQPRQPTSFSSLTPSRRRRACLEDGMSIEIPTTSPKRAMVSHAFQLSSVVISEEKGRLKKDEEEDKEKWKRKCEHEEQWVPSRSYHTAVGMKGGIMANFAAKVLGLDSEREEDSALTGVYV